MFRESNRVEWFGAGSGAVKEFAANTETDNMYGPHIASQEDAFGKTLSFVFDCTDSTAPMLHVYVDGDLWWTDATIPAMSELFPAIMTTNDDGNPPGINWAGATLSSY